MSAPAISAPGNLLRVADLSVVQLNALLDLADAMREGPGWWASPTRRGAVACLFAEQFAQARGSFEVAVHRLGMLPIRLPADARRLVRGDSLHDTARAVSSYAEAIVAATQSHPTLVDIAGAASVPVVNAGTADHHPCQALTDLLTLRRHFGYLSGLRLVYLGSAGSVAHSLMEAGALAGMQVVVATPRGHEPRHDVTERATAMALAHGGSVQVGHDPRAATVAADAVYTDGWPAGDRDGLGPYRVDTPLMRIADPHAVFLHRLPAHRGDEVTPEVIDGPASVVWEQAANRLPSQQALLHTVLASAEGRIPG